MAVGWIFVVFLAIVVIVIGIVLYNITNQPPNQKCTSNGGCPAGQNCVNDLCVCTGNASCANGQICSGGTCIPAQQCSAVTPCPSGQMCINGICQGSGQTYIQDLVLVQGAGSVCPNGYVYIEKGGGSNLDLVQDSSGQASPLYMCSLYGPYNGPGSVVTDIVVSKGTDQTDTFCPPGFTELSYNRNGNGTREVNIELGCGNQDYPAPYTIICIDKTGSTNSSPLKDLEVTISATCDTNLGYTPVKLMATSSDFDFANLNQNCGGQTTQLCSKT